MTIITLSERGISVGNKIADFMDGSKHIVFIGNENSLSSIFKSAWREGPIVSVMATQITVRMIAGLVRDKKSDPAVISVDEEGKYVIPVLSGHMGGANTLAKKIAKKLDAQAIVTTASDLMGVHALDELSERLRYKIDHRHNLASVMTGILNKKRVCLFGEKGDAGALASHYEDNAFEILPIEKYLPGNGKHRILLTDRAVPASNEDLILRPVRNHLGLGFRKDTAIDMLKAATAECLAAANIVPGSIAAISSIDIKAGSGLVGELADDYEAKVIYYTTEQLKTAAITGQSDFVMESVGVGAVSEPAAVLSSGGGELIIRKFVHGGVALSIAKANWP